MRSPDKIRAILNDYVLARVAEETGLHLNTIYAFVHRKKDTRLSVVEKLDSYIDSKLATASQQG